MKEIADGLSIAHFAGDDGLSAFLTVGAAGETALGMYIRACLAGRTASDGEPLPGSGIGFGCSTLSARNAAGDVLFGRNLDWERSAALILTDVPASGDYASVSTVNPEIMRYCGIGDLSALTEEDFLKAALYFPLDGMNEKGFAISVNMIKDGSVSAYETAPGKTPINFTAAIRLLLNRAATVDEAIALLGNYSMSIPGGGQLFHFAMCDRTGKSVVVEYINGQMYVTDTPSVTNFYLTPNEVSGTNKYGIGTDQSVQRYETLMAKLTAAKNENGASILDAEGIREALSSVAKSNFNVPGSSTEWSIVFNLATGEVIYYRRENWSDPYICHVPNTTAASTTPDSNGNTAL